MEKNKNTIYLYVTIDSMSEPEAKSGYGGSFPDCYAFYERKREADVTVSEIEKMDGSIFKKLDTPHLLKKIICETGYMIDEFVDGGYSHLECISLGDAKKGDSLKLVLKVDDIFIENLRRAHTLHIYKNYGVYCSREGKEGYVLADNVEVYIRVG